jgi:hypothetical protein
MYLTRSGQVMREKNFVFLVFEPANQRNEPRKIPRAMLMF